MNLKLFLLLLTTTLATAQQEASVWYFGDHAGIYYNAETQNLTLISSGHLGWGLGAGASSEINIPVVMWYNSVMNYFTKK